jgi:putative ATP-dependent endonuclease of the OLD family
MRIAQVECFNFRGLKTGKITLPSHSVLLGANSVGKTAVVESIALVFGRERITAQLSDWDFFGGSPKPDTRFTIVCTVTDFSTNDPDNHTNWFSGESSAQPVWWHEDTSTLTFETDCPIGGRLAAQVALCGRYDAEECEFETKRYFYHGPGNPFTDACDVVPFRRLEELGVFIIPGNRQWDRLMSFGSSSFLKALRQSDAIPGVEIEKLKQELRTPNSSIEDAPEFKAILESAEAELRSFVLLRADSALVYRTTSLDTFDVLQNLLPHVRDAQGALLPLSRQGAGMVSLQSFLVVLAIAQKRKKAGKNFILVAEEPELHLHPSLHKRLANRIRAMSTQSLITTHSPLVAAAYRPTECILLRNKAGDLSAASLRNEPVKDITSNAIRKLYLQKREPFYEAILGAAVLVPEGEYDYEWLQLLQRMVESSDNASLSSLPLSVVPTQDGAVVDTFLEVARFNSNILPIVDGDQEGKRYLDLLCSVTPAPENVVQLGEGAGIEILAAWVLEPSLSNPGSALENILLTSSHRTLKELQRALLVEQNKKNRELRENLASDALDNPICVSRAAEFLADISAILNHSPAKNPGWKQSDGPSGVRIHVASHIRKA